MKKILPITLLAVAAVFLLSSCDSMLEALFPKDTVGVNTGNNTITFEIKGWDYNYPLSGYLHSGTWEYLPPGANELTGWVPTYTNSRIYVELYDQANNLVGTAQSTNFAGTYVGDPNGRQASVQFFSLKDGSYSFKVWYDVDGDGKPDFESQNYNYWYFTGSATTSSGAYITSQYVQGEQTETLTVDLYEYADTNVK